MSTPKAGSATPETPSTSSSATPKVHLVVCCHGLWGEPAHLSYIAKTLVGRWGGELSPRSADSTEGVGEARKSSVSSREAPGDQPADANGISNGDATGGRASAGSPALVVLNTASNSGIHTYDGIDWCAERVTVEISKEIDRLRKGGREVTRFSILGYSLGGLIARYTAGLLYARGFFDKVKPVNFTTFATPHIGVSPTGGAFAALSAWIGSRSLGRTGFQLYGSDFGWHPEAESNPANGKPAKISLLDAMSKPQSSFLRALTSFENVDFYANATSDWVVPIRSGALMEVDPWRGWPEGGELDLAGKGIELEFLEDYPALVTSVRIPQTAPERKALPRRILQAIIPRRWPWLLNPYRVPWPFPFNWIAVIFSPVVIPLFLCLVVYKLQSGARSSNKRVKQIEKDWIEGKGHLQDKELVYNEEHERSRIQEVLTDTIRGVAEDNVELPDLHNHPHHENGATNGDAIRKPRETTTPLALALTPEARQYLAKKEVPLTSTQKAIQDNLNSIPGLRKHLVFFDNVVNSHAIIVCRTPSIEVHRRGKVVIQHYADHFQL